MNITNMPLSQKENRSIFFSDLDGTLLNDKKEITPQTFAAITKWMEAGNILALSSGRPLGSILEVIENSKIGWNADAGVYSSNLYAIAFNGGLIYHVASKTKLAQDNLNAQQIADIISIAFDEGVFCQAYDDTSILIPYDGPEIQHYRKTVHLPVKILPNFQQYACDQSCKILCIDLQHPEKLLRVADRMKEIHGDSVTCVKSNPFLLEVFPATAGKGNAVHVLCKLLGIPISQSYAAGDEQNDISMLEAAGCGIAMQNAVDLVKNSADVVTKTNNNEDGLLPFFCLT
ncbi:MAG: Cof-type HAD-IIB family hydrolase [Lachnospiraceae bacterium]